MWKTFVRCLLGEQLKSGLPERVQATITKQQDDSEILISWFQLTLVLFFSALYFVSPKTSEWTGFQPVPWALGIYFLFTVIRVVTAHRRLMRRWFLLLSVIMDIGLLMVLIWSFHIQYEQPPSFYLKAPTMLYVFIFIGLRALRFQAEYILAAGAAAAIGWAVLIVYVVVSDPVDNMITRDYVRYMTSNSILIGAEIDKIVSILLVTIILAVAIMRAHRLLNRAVSDSMLAQDLSRFVSSEVAEHIAGSENGIRPGDGESRFATVLFTDLEGFSTISERLTPKQLVAALNDYFSAVNKVIERYGGVIIQFEGDAMLIAFNTVTPDEDHAANAVRTAIGIDQAMTEGTFGGISLRTRCGLNTGEMVAGAIGAEERLVFTVHGDEVNIAARMENLNKEYGTYILATESTVKAAGGDFAFERMDDVTVRGRSTPTTAYAIRGAQQTD